MKRTVGSRHYASRPNERVVKDGLNYYTNTAYVEKAKTQPRKAVKAPTASSSNKYRKQRVQALYGRSKPPKVPALVGNEVEEEWRDVMNARSMSSMDADEIARRIVEHVARDEESVEDEFGHDFIDKVRRWGKNRHERHDSDTLSLVSTYLTHNDPSGQVCNVREMGNKVVSMSAKPSSGRIMYDPRADEYRTLTHAASPVDKKGEMITDPSKIKWKKARLYGVKKMVAEGKEPRPSKKQIRKAQV